MSMAGKPDSFVLFYDEALSGASSVDSVFSEAGARIGPITSLTGNLGGLVPEFEDVSGLDADARDIQVLITAAGGLGTAQWVWQPDPNATTPGEPRGLNDVRRLSYPWQAYIGGDTSPAIVYSSVYHRVLVFAVDEAPDDIIVRYWDSDEGIPDGTDANADKVTSVSFTPDFLPDTGDHALAACELQDGSLILAIRRLQREATPTSISNGGDFDIYKSTDGGDTWALVSASILFRFIAGGDGDEPLLGFKSMFRLASSGPWIRLCFHAKDDQDDEYLFTIYSSDGGMSWKETGTRLSTTQFKDADHDGDIAVFDIAGAGNAAGTFWYAAKASAGGLVFKYASRDEAWQAYTQPTEALAVNQNVEAESVCCVADHRFMYTFSWHHDNATVDDHVRIWRQPLNDLFNDATDGPLEISTEKYMETRGAMRFYPGKLTAVWTGSAFGFLACIMNKHNDESNISEISGRRLIYFQMGGWDTRPIAATGAYSIFPGGFTSLEWQPWMGTPAGGGNAVSSTQTQWTLSRTGATTSFQQPAIFQLNSDANGQLHRYQIELSNKDGPPAEWTNHGDELTRKANMWIAEWVMLYRDDNPASVPIDALNHGVALRVPQGNTSNKWRIDIRIGSEGAVVWDQANSAPLATLQPAAGLTIQRPVAGPYTRFVFAVSPTTTFSDPPTAVLMASQTDDPYTWYSTDPFTIPDGNTTGPTEQEFRWGVLGHSVGSTTVSSVWKRCTVYQPGTVVDYGTDPTPAAEDLPGQVATNRPVYMERGLLVRWGGGGANRDDKFNMAVGHDYAVENIFMDSPRLRWRSLAGQTAGQAIVFDAGKGTDAEARFIADSVALFDLESHRVVIDFSSDAASWSGGATLNTESLTGLSLASVDGKVVELTYGVAGARDGSLAGAYLRVTAAASSAALNNVYRVSRHTGTHLELEEGAWPVSQLTAADTVSVFYGRGFATFTGVTKRYMRLRFGSTGDEAWKQQWVAGSVVVGQSFPFRVPLDWSHGDEMFDNVSKMRTRSGITWAYEEGPPTRMFTGRVIGDTSDFRDEFRDMLNTFNGLTKRPMVLCIDEDAMPEDLYLVRWAARSVRHDNQAWYPASDDWKTHRKAGDMQVQFSEVT